MPLKAAARVATALRAESGSHERVSRFHSAARGHGPAHAGHRAGGLAGPALFADFGAAAGRLPDHPGADAVPRRQSRCDEPHGDGAAGAPVRPDVWPGPHEQHQRGRRVHRHAAVRAQRVHGHGRAAGAGRHQRRDQLFAGRSALAAGLRQGQPGRCAGADAGHSLGQPAADRGAEHGQHAAGAKDQPGLGRGFGDAGGWAKASRAHSGQHRRTGRHGHGPGHGAQRHQQRQLEQRQRQLRRPDARLLHQRQRPAEHGRAVRRGHHRLQERRARAPERRVARHQRRRERSPGGLGGDQADQCGCCGEQADQHRCCGGQAGCGCFCSAGLCRHRRGAPRHLAERAAPARRQRHRHGGRDQKATARPARQPARQRHGRGADRPHARHPRIC